MKEEGACEELMESCVSVRGKEGNSGMIIWKGSRVKNDWGHNVEGDTV